MTKKRGHKKFWQMNMEIYLEKVKLGKFSTESENVFGNRGEIWNRVEMHHCLRGDGSPCECTT